MNNIQRLLSIIFIAFFIAPLGCDEAVEAPAPTPCAEESTPCVQLGEGVEDWKSFADDPTVKVTYGIQGGFHLDLSARFWGIDPEGVSLTFEVIDPIEDKVLNFPTRLILSAARTDCFTEGYCQRLGVRAIFDVREDPEEVLLNKDLRVILTARQGTGASYTDEHTIRVTEVGW